MSLHISLNILILTLGIFLGSSLALPIKSSSDNIEITEVLQNLEGDLAKLVSDKEKFQTEFNSETVKRFQRILDKLLVVSYIKKWMGSVCDDLSKKHPASPTATPPVEEIQAEEKSSSESISKEDIPLDVNTEPVENKDVIEALPLAGNVHNLEEEEVIPIENHKNSQEEPESVLVNPVNSEREEKVKEENSEKEMTNEDNLEMANIENPEKEIATEIPEVTTLAGENSEKEEKTEDIYPENTFVESPLQYFPENPESIQTAMSANEEMIDNNGFLHMIDNIGNVNIDSDFENKNKEENLSPSTSSLTSEEEGDKMEEEKLESELEIEKPMPLPLTMNLHKESDNERVVDVDSNPTKNEDFPLKDLEVVSESQIGLDNLIPIPTALMGSEMKDPLKEIELAFMSQGKKMIEVEHENKEEEDEEEEKDEENENVKTSETVAKEKEGDEDEEESDNQNMKSISKFKPQLCLGVGDSLKDIIRWIGKSRKISIHKFHFKPQLCIEIGDIFVKFNGSSESDKDKGDDEENEKNERSENIKEPSFLNKLSGLLNSHNK